MKKINNLYAVHFDGAVTYVEAPSFACAVEAWRAFGAREFDLDVSAQPESVELLDSDEPVVRWDDLGG